MKKKDLENYVNYLEDLVFGAEMLFRFSSLVRLGDSKRFESWLEKKNLILKNKELLNKK